ncbi:Heat shock protein SSA2 [Smittium culicis]|uniref:Heat shock protein SSA2 n=1 Tax=Smittium culicis TaxID=133412 RepID=A0A1R1Y972_9FUNG|nr:Heat shock protein SSA2 [Smittium culicis]
MVIDEFGDRTTPSIISFSEERIIGKLALEQIETNPTNTIYNAKRFVGKRFTESEFKSGIYNFPSNLVLKNSKPLYRVIHNEEVWLLNPEQVLSMILEKLKNNAEDFLGGEIEYAVITVPAYFNDSQRQATVDAAEVAGLKPIKILNEPTAAAIAYGILESKDICKRILVYDLGGGTFDITVIQVKNNDFQVLATGGDANLGGEDFSNNLVNFFIEKFKSDHNLDVKTDAGSLNRLKNKCEMLKTHLSIKMSANIEIPSLINGLDMSYNLTRAKFEEINMDLFESTIEMVKDVLNRCKITPSGIDNVLMVGGSTRIPYIKKIVSKLFNDKILNKNINPDELVAIGASIVARSYDNDINRGISIKDVIPLSLGVNIKGDVMCVLLEKNTSVPCKATRNFATHLECQSEVFIEVYQGVRVENKHNHFLGEFALSCEKSFSEGKSVIEVTFEVDINGILKVNASELGSKIPKTCESFNYVNRFTKSEISRMIEEGKKFAELDLKYYKKIDARNKLEKRLAIVRRKISAEKYVTIGLDLTLINSQIELCEELINSTRKLEKKDFEDNRHKLDELFIDIFK